MRKRIRRWLVGPDLCRDGKVDKALKAARDILVELGSNGMLMSGDREWALAILERLKEAHYALPE